ncbi:MPPV-246 ankyrin repeat protein [Magpiepox virus 2]|nr:MPPV-246 ankyrin repeat protein [Magpiepox virus 2]
MYVNNMYINDIYIHDSVPVFTMMIKLLLENKLINDEEVSEIKQIKDEEYKIIESLIRKVTCEKKYILDLILYKACSNQQLDLVDLLIKYGADVNMRLYYNDLSPFFISIHKNNIDIAQLLLDVGCDYKKDIKNI